MTLADITWLGYHLVILVDRLYSLDHFIPLIPHLPVTLYIITKLCCRDHAVMVPDVKPSW